MQEQANSENPESLNVAEEHKGRQELKKKKVFKIKKIKMSNTRKLKQQDIFNNPIYAGLQNQDDENQNKQNFGPWIHQDFKTQDIKSPLQIQRVQYQTHKTQEVSERLIQNNDTDENFDENGFMQDKEPLQHNVLPEIKQKKELHELRFSSLVLEAPRLSSISPPKLQRSKIQRLNRNKSQSQSSQLLKYISLKNLIPLQSNTERNKNSKPNNVIYNYCCSSNQNNIMGYFQDPFYKNSSNKSGLSNKKLFKDQLPYSKLIKPGIKQAKKYSLETQQQEINLFKKSISKQLFNDLIRKKNKVK